MVFALSLVVLMIVAFGAGMLPPAAHPRWIQFGHCVTSDSELPGAPPGRAAQLLCRAAEALRWLDWIFLVRSWKSRADIFLATGDCAKTTCLTLT